MRTFALIVQLLPILLRPLFLNEPKKLCLKGRREVGDLVE